VAGIGLECVPWNAGTTGPNEPLQATCARLNCMSDADCTGAGFGSCANATIFALDAERVFFATYCASGETKLANETCSVSRRVTQAIDGCVEGLSCWVGLYDTNRDTGRCAEECERTAQDNNGGCGTDRPYCNPLFTITGTASVPGVCQENQRGPGDICARVPSGFCDFNSPGEVSCAQIGQDATDPNSFVCLEFCDVATNTACPASNALGSQRAVTCEDLSPSDPADNDGLCSIDCSEPFFDGAPDSCIAELGTATCLRLTTTGGFSGGICQQVPGPYLDREFLLFDQQNQIAGVQPNHVNCTPATADNCAPGSFCLALNQAGTDGACATFCLGTATGTTASGCEILNDNEVLCVAPIPGIMSTEVGICGKRQ
jgi:hypothetical protein